jgi:hypothetical protein
MSARIGKHSFAPDTQTLSRFAETLPRDATERRVRNPLYLSGKLLLG